MIVVSEENKQISGDKRTKKCFRIGKKRFDISDSSLQRNQPPQQLHDITWTKW